MRFKQHSELKDRHAFLSASKPSWIRYTPERVIERYADMRAAQRGTELHALAHECIRLGVEIAHTHQTLNMYVNDCIGYRMVNEQPLYYSDFAFGTADAIGFRNGPDGVPTLYIFDLKTGKNKVSAEQLLVYAAYFCLEYNQSPMSIDFDLRIYQNDQIFHVEVFPEDILHIMDRIKENDKIIKDALDRMEV